MDYFIQSNYSLEDLEDFRDSNGFIDLTSAGIQLTNESREKRGTVDRFKNWVDFNGKKALIRGEVVDAENYSIYAELIVEEIAKELSIDSAHYDLIKLKDEDGVEKFGVLSESIIDFDKEELFSLRDLIGDEPRNPNEKIDYASTVNYQFTLEQLRKRLKSINYSEQDIDKIISDYNKRSLFYLTVLDIDKHPENISFIKEINGNSNIKLSPNYDSEFSLFLEKDKEMAEFFLDYPSEFGKEMNIQDPRIGTIVSKKDGGWNEMWKDTLELLIEDDEIYDYYNNNIREKINMEEILQKVESRIHAPLPSIVKNIAIKAYNTRNNTIEKIVDGELQPKQGKQEKLTPNSFLNELISKSTQASIRTGEQIAVGKTMENDMAKEKYHEYDNLLDKLFPSLDD